MKKNELVHLHALLARVATDYLERGLLEPADCEPYESLGVTPLSLRASRDSHEEAVLALARLLARASRPEAEAEAETRGRESPPPTG
jgi:hypothetical protein